jgi:chromosome segregation protein
MKLKKLEITGFKSFCDKASIEFPQGVSAIVGPNGCGKSNIVDALRWVMGEQSVKQLRGKSMEDVIFAGANGKPPLNLAEVTLTLANDNGSAPEELKDFTEIMLSRRLFRSGESGYFLNKQPCRLKDIHNVFLGSGLGTKSYSIIQQGNIGAIIDAGPEERRYFIEEAAGTTRYKNRKNEALRKVISTNQNLLRVSDIISEIKRQMGSLKRQARKAERYKRYRNRADELDIRLSLLKYTEYCRQIEETDHLQRELKDADIEHTSQIRKLDAAVEEIKLQRAQKNQEISTQKSRKFDLMRKIDRLENDIDHLKQEIERLTSESIALQSARLDLESKNEKIGSEIEQAESEISRLQEEITTIRNHLHQGQEEATELKTLQENLSEELETSKTALMDRMAEEARYKNIFQNAANNKENLQRRLKRAAEEAVTARQKVEQFRGSKSTAEESLAQLTQQAAELKEKLERVRKLSDEKREALGRQVKHTQSLELERNNAKSKYATLKKMEENFEWYRDGVKAIMKSPEFNADTNQTAADPQQKGDFSSKAIMGLLADIIEPTPDYQPAVEAILGESLQYILVDGPDTGARAIEYLQSNDAGRSGFIPVGSLSASGKDHPRPFGAFSTADTLLRHVSVKKGYERIAEAFLGNVLVVENIQMARDIHSSNDRPGTIVTREGDIISSQGIMIGGSKDKLPGILAKKQELKTLRQQIVSYEQKLDDARSQQNSLEIDVRKIETELQQIYENKTSVDTQVVEAEKALYRASEELKHAVRHLEIVDLEHEQLLGEESDIDDEIARYNAALEQLTTAIDAAREDVAERTRQLSNVSARLDTVNRKVIDRKLTVTALTARLENSNSTLRRLKEFQQDGAIRLVSVTEDIALKNQKSTAARQRVNEDENSLALTYEELKELEQTLETNESNYSTIDAHLKDSDSAISELESERDKILENSRILDIEQTQRRVHRDNTIKRLEEQHRKPFEEFRVELDALKEQSGTENPDDDATEALENELLGLREKISAIGDVNLAAINEFEQLKSRHDFLCEQREDLNKAIEDLHKVIKKINRITQQRFIETFNLVNEKLTDVFPRLFEGGSAKMVLTEPEKPLETGVEFMIHPPGKKLTRMSLLSGGEKALSAIAFIFSLFLIRPAAFCLMDEIDAPLDEANVFRFNNLLKLIGEKSQIIMVTHNKNSMEFADMLFGITMETKGVSKVVSVNLDR